MLLMGVDAGTTGVKVAVFNEAGGMLGYGFREYDILFGKPGYAEQDAELVWRRVKEAMAAAAAQAGGGISAVSVSTQGDAVIPVGRNGEALCPAQLGMDYRASAEVAEISEQLGDRAVFQKTGMRPHPLNSVIKMMWFERHMPGLKKALWKYMTYSDFILHKLGSDEPVIDLTMASRTMCMDLLSGDWSGEVLSACGVDPACLSKPVPSGAVVGRLGAVLAGELGVRPGALLVAGGHDQTCAALGAGVVKEGMALDSHGTAEVLSAALCAPRLDDVLFSNHYPCYRHAVDGMFFTFGLNHTGGVLLKWYRDNIASAEAIEAEKAGQDAYDRILSMSPAGPSPLLVLPHFNGGGAPAFDPLSKGAILGLTLGSTRHDIAKAILDATAFELRNHVTTMLVAGIEVRELTCVGGGARSATGLQLKADVTGLPVRTLKVREAACLGAAILAGAGAGAFACAKEAAGLALADRIYEPEQDMHERYEDKFKVYCGLYDALREINTQIQAW
jgi:xylulokinase